MRTVITCSYPECDGLELVDAEGRSAAEVAGIMEAVRLHAVVHGSIPAFRISDGVTVVDVDYRT